VSARAEILPSRQKHRTCFGGLANSLDAGDLQNRFNGSLAALGGSTIAESEPLLVLRGKEMKTITGSFARPDGSPAANATLYLLLSQDVVASSPMVVVVHARDPITLDANGNIPVGTQVWCNDEVNPSGTFTHVVVVDPVFGKCFDERLVIQGPSPINLASLVPALQPS
jgi:hypothetical protein